MVMLDGAVVMLDSGSDAGRVGDDVDALFCAETTLQKHITLLGSFDDHDHECCHDFTATTITTRSTG